MDPQLDFRLLNDFQRDFPLSARPYAVLAERLGSAEATVIERLRRMQDDGRISRIGAVLRPGCFGVSTLVAMAVPESRLAEVALAVNAFPGVNHNYQREHRYNLWFVLTAADAAALARVLAGIEALAGVPALSLPMEKAYHIDLGFPLDGARRPRRHAAAPAAGLSLDARQRCLLGRLQDGLPLLARPFLAMGRDCASSEAEVIAGIAGWQASGAISRFGVVVRHRELGFAANAMLVQDIPDAEVDRVAAGLAGEAAVTLCYRRPRQLPHWRYNLFCMIHGQCRDSVAGTIDRLRHRHALAAVPHAVLFSQRCFKQTGARYV